MLFARGWRFSVNIDPDVFCVSAWDLNELLRVRLLAGRPVGSNARTARWLQDLQATPSSGAATADNVTSLLLRKQR